MLLSRSIRPMALPAGVRQMLLGHASSAYTTATQPAPSPASPSAAPSEPSTVSAAEMSHFSALASSWWDPEGPSRILHLMNPLRHTFIQRCHATHPSRNTHTESQPPRKLRYLDVGCGGGIFAESAARLSTTASVTAIDPTPAVIAVARKHQREDPLLLEPGRLTYLNTAIENLPLPATPSEGVDVLSCFEVIEHISAPAPFLAKCLPHVRPGGWLVLSTMSRTWTSWLTTIVAAEDVMRVVPRGTHDWNQYINEAEMRAWANKVPGWSCAMTMGVIYIPGLGWKEVKGSEGWGNYFFAIKRDE